MKPYLPLVWLLLATLTGCLVDDEAVTPTGDVAVLVTDQRGTPVAGARVYTEPISRLEVVTDEFGSKTVRGVPVGTYDVLAERDGARAKQAISIPRGGLTSVTLQLPVILPGGGNPDGSPRVFVSAPRQNRTYSTSEGIEFDATASDDDTPGRDLTFRWTSNIDGLVGEGTGDDDGRLTFVKTLSPGFHQLSVAATDTDGRTTTLLLGVNVAGQATIRLAPVDATGAEPRLTWSRFTGRDFRHYRVQRATGDCAAAGFDRWQTLATVPGVADTAYVDRGPRPVAGKVCYRIVVATASETAAATSNVASYAPPTTDLLGFVPTALVAHPTEANTVFLVDGATDRVVAYDLRARATRATATLSGGLGEPSVGDAGRGVEVFVPSGNGNVYVLDPATLAQKTLINTVDPVGSVAVFAEGFLVVGGTSQTVRAGQYRSYSRATGALLASNVQLRGPGVIRRVPGQRVAVALSTTSLTADPAYFEFDAEGQFTFAGNGVVQRENEQSSAVFAVDPTGAYFVTSRLANTFEVSRQLNFRGRLDYGAYRVGAIAFSAAGDLVYGGVLPAAEGAEAVTPGLVVARWPSRVREGFFPTRGFVTEAARLADGRIVTVQVSDPTRATAGAPGGVALVAVVP